MQHSIKVSSCIYLPFVLFSTFSWQICSKILNQDDLESVLQDVKPYFREEIAPFANVHQKDVPEETMESTLYHNDVADHIDVMTSFKEKIKTFIEAKEGQEV